LVGIGRYFSVITIPIPKGNSVSNFGIKNLAGAPQKIGGSAPFFLRRGGLGPRFVHFALLLKKKEFPRNFSKKDFPRILKKVFPPKLTVQQYRPKIPKAQQI
jgi:hypothetical protein